MSTKMARLTFERIVRKYNDLVGGLPGDMEMFQDIQTLL